MFEDDFMMGDLADIGSYSTPEMDSAMMPDQSTTLPDKDIMMASNEQVQPQSDRRTTLPEQPQERATDFSARKRFSPEIEGAIRDAAASHNVKRDDLGTFISVESDGNPRNVTGSYRGLGQLDQGEWNRHKPRPDADIYNPNDNALATASLMAKNRQDFINRMGREPTLAEQYLTHNQGLGFYTRNITTNLKGNLPREDRIPENMTREGFERYWTNRINQKYAEGGTAPMPGASLVTRATAPAAARAAASPVPRQSGEEAASWGTQPGQKEHAEEPEQVDPELLRAIAPPPQPHGGPQMPQRMTGGSLPRLPMMGGLARLDLYDPERYRYGR